MGFSSGGTGKGLDAALGAATSAGTAAAKKKRRARSPIVVAGQAERRNKTRYITFDRPPVLVAMGGERTAPIDPPIHGFMLDISEVGVGLVVGERLCAADQVIITIENKQGARMEIQGQVCWQQRIPSSEHVLKLRPTPWRVGIKLSFKNEMEANAFAGFVLTMARIPD